MQTLDPNQPKLKTPHHYVLAHISLRQVVQVNPYGFFNVMASPQRQEFLDILWEQLCEKCDAEGSADFTAKDIWIYTTAVCNFPAVLIAMPPAHFVGQAHLVCVVLCVSREDMNNAPDNPVIKYFTLEKGISIPSGAERTVFCAWDGDSHLNYGDGPELSGEAFLERISALLCPPGSIREVENFMH